MSSSIEQVKNLQIPLQELSLATDGFSECNLIAKSGYGKVYKGTSVKHGNIAIKMLDPLGGQGDHEFNAEIALLSVYKHENIVLLVGFCDEDEQKILVYKYESNGSLDRHLSRPDLTWVQRLKICLDAARGLQYLHDDVGSEHRVLHRDVRSSNVLLDENCRAKISDFGLSRIVLCGRLTRVTKYKDQRQFLINLVKIHWSRKTLDEIICSHLHKQMHRGSLLTFSTIAYQCLMSGNERPTMKKVVEQLQKALDIQLAASGSSSSLDDDAFVARPKPQSTFSASSSQSGPSSSSPHRWNYDVFISYRGEDTRKTFVDHLYMTLLHKHLTYKDHEVDYKLLVETLEESRIAIIVFSKNYANSSWCLDELVRAMENSDDRGQIVIPIFYGVEPSEVRLQTRGYGEAIAMHELRCNNDHKVESWRKALTRAGSVPGWDISKDADSKPQLIKRICDDVSCKLLNLMIPSEASVKARAKTDLIGIETRVKELKSLVEVGSDGVHMVGICGMWGSGKSTLAYSIYDEISHEFEGSCFVENVRSESRTHGLKMLQEKILSDLLKTKVTLKSIEQGTYMMERNLCQNRVLIVLDDVDHIDHLKKLAGSKKWFGDGSRIIITTENEDLVNAQNGTTYNVRMLDIKEDIKLFARHAFGAAGVPVEAVWELSLSIVSKLGGHPSAIKTLGAYLHRKDTSVWMKFLDKVADRPVDEVLRQLKTLDDGLARNIFARFLR